MYEKMNHLPPEGSLRQAVCLTVWLRRQEIEVNKAKLSMLAGMGEPKAAFDAYRVFLDSIFPFSTQVRDAEDQKMREMMAKEVAKGPLTFSSATIAPIKKFASSMSLTEDFKKRLSESRKNNRKLR